MWGIRTTVPDYANPFSTEGKTTYCGVVTNGYDIFESGGVTFSNVGCLKNNLEYFHNLTTGELFLYYDKGNPAEKFDDIKITLKGTGISLNSSLECGYPTVIDNLAVKYTGAHGMAGGAFNLTIQNCEIGWIGGSTQGGTTRYGNGIEAWGDCNNYTVKDCYLYQCYDDNITSQCMISSNKGGVLAKDIRFSGNVMSHTTAAFELWSANLGEGDLHLTDIGQTSIIKNAIISDNYMLYMGYGHGHQRPYEYDPHKGAKMIDCSGFGNQQFSNVVFENNVGIHSAGYVHYIQQFKTPGIGPYSVRGAVLRNNTYIVSDKCLYTKSDLGRLDRLLYNYDERTLAYLTSLGIEKGSAFYYYECYLYDEEADGLYR